MYLYIIEREKVVGNEPWVSWSSSKPAIKDPEWVQAAKANGVYRILRVTVPVWSPFRMATFLNDECNEKPLRLGAQTVWEA